MKRSTNELVSLSRIGTVEDPIRVKSGGPEQFVGCSGSPAGSHDPIWVVVSLSLPTRSQTKFFYWHFDSSSLQLTKDRPISRCMECGSVYEMEYIGPEESHDDHHHGMWHKLLPTHSLSLREDVVATITVTVSTCETYFWFSLKVTSLTMSQSQLQIPLSSLTKTPRLSSTTSSLSTGTDKRIAVSLSSAMQEKGKVLLMGLGERSTWSLVD